MGDIVSIVGLIATLVAIIGGGVALYSALRRPIDRLDEKIDRLDAKLSHEISEFRLETQTTLARHDERLAAIERQGPRLQLH